MLLASFILLNAASKREGERARPTVHSAVGVTVATRASVENIYEGGRITVSTFWRRNYFLAHPVYKM